jgi:predicted amidohydrolase YtcJ
MRPDELILRQVEVDGAVVDVQLVGERITAVGPALRPSAPVEVIDGAGGALIPGLHDHHIHLLAAAAAARSVRVGPADVRNRAGLATRLHDAARSLPAGRWLRAVGYHESVAGDLDRYALDELVPSRPVRVQHRGGARWTLNSAAISALGLDRHTRPELDRDARGELTGRLHRSDEWLRALLPPEPLPDLAGLGDRLARAGVTGVTDATPYEEGAAFAPISRAVADGSLPQHVLVTGGPGLAAIDPPQGVALGPVKVIIDDATYPSLDALAGWIGAAHARDRTVAIHCVTRAAIVLALAAWDVAGSRAGDRVEHGSVIPPEQIVHLARHHITVVTQPGFVTERGDDYLREVDHDDLPHLYPCHRLLDAGVHLAGSTDAPYSDPDPWRAVHAAITRRTPSGAVLGPVDALSPRRALELFLGDPLAPGGPPRRVEAGAPADLCLLAAPLADVLTAPAEAHVVHTLIAGRPIT